VVCEGNDSQLPCPGRLEDGGEFFSWGVCRLEATQCVNPTKDYRIGSDNDVFGTTDPDLMRNLRSYD
jgi:hypothetical protein